MSTICIYVKEATSSQMYNTIPFHNIDFQIIPTFSPHIIGEPQNRSFCWEIRYIILLRPRNLPSCIQFQHQQIVMRKSRNRTSDDFLFCVTFREMHFSDCVYARDRTSRRLRFYEVVDLSSNINKQKRKPVKQVACIKYV